MKKEMKCIQQLILLLLSTALTAQAVPQLGTKSLVFRPAVLKKYIVKESELEALTAKSKKSKAPTYGQNTTSTNEPWYVYSDRTDNTTYEAPSLNATKCGSLDFNEEVIIAQIENGFALVYTEPGIPIYPKITSRAKCKGWVPISNLLLWNTCPANEKGIYNKALIVGNIDKMMKDDPTVGLYFKNPETKAGKANLHSAMRFYFVMKKDPITNMHLLADYSRVGGKIKSSLFGWVSPGMYTPWSQRTCLEPNWKKDAMDNLQGQSIPVGPLVWENAKKKGKPRVNTATKIELGKKRNHLTNVEALDYRLLPRTLRYPLLNSDTQPEFYQITAFASNNGNEATVDAAADATDKVQKVLDNMRIINLIFVVDGSKNMTNYFKTIQSTITRASGTDYFGRDNRTIRVGFVIYRDKADGKYTTEYLSMRKPTDAKLTAWLKNGGEYGFKSSSDDTSDYQALYEGLKVALDAKKMGYSRVQSNLMFVIGDCGNDPNDQSAPPQEEIIKKCVENRIQLSSFNVRNIDAGPYQQFRKQMARIVMKNMETQYAQLGPTAKHEYVPLEDGYDFKPGIDPETTFFIGTFRNVETGREMSSKQLYSLFYSTSQRVNETITRQESLLIDVQRGSDKNTDSRAASQIDEKFLVTVLGKTTLDALKKTNFLVAFTGYTPQKSEAGINYWQPVIYISHLELIGLLDQLKRVNDEVDKQSDDREAYVNAMKALAASMLGDLDEDELLKMKNEDIMDMVTGLNVKTEALSYRLVDIQNKKKVDQKQYRELTSRFVEQYKKIDAIRQKNYPFSYKDANGETWYWIPAEDLP